MVSGDDCTNIVWRLGVYQLISDDDLGRYVKLGFQLLLPLGAKQFGTDDKEPGNAFARDELARDEARADCFAQADIVGKKCHGKATAEVDEVCDLMVVRFKPLALPARLGLQIRAAIDDDRVDEAPFQRRLVQVKFGRRVRPPQKLCGQCKGCSVSQGTLFE